MLDVLHPCLNLYFILSFLLDINTTSVTVKRNKDACFPFPKSTTLCSFSTDNYINLMVGPQCVVPINIHEYNIKNHSCYIKLDIPFDVNFIHDSNMTCLSKWQQEVKETVIQFACPSDESLKNWIVAHSVKIYIGKCFDIVEVI